MRCPTCGGSHIPAGEGDGCPECERRRREATRGARTAAARAGGGRRLGAGMCIGPYVLVAPLGAGASGEVWEGRHGATGERVAIKVPHDPDVISSLRREGAIQGRIRSPRIVRVRAMDLESDPPYLACDLVLGESLRTRLDRGPLAPSEALAILIDVAGGLVDAHRAGVLHRDLKPENILLDGSGRAFLTDFGLGQAASAASRPLLDSVDGAAGPISGTFDYMSPEQRAGHPLDERCDVYAFGVVLFEALTGRRPVGPERPSDLVPDLPASLDDLHQECCARIEARLPSMQDVLSHIERASTPGVPGPAAPGAPRDADRHGRSGVVARYWVARPLSWVGRGHLPREVLRIWAAYFAGKRPTSLPGDRPADLWTWPTPAWRPQIVAAGSPRPRHPSDRRPAARRHRLARLGAALAALLLAAVLAGWALLGSAAAEPTPGSPAAPVPHGP